ncbi:MAG: type II toxin-antitoxin system RelE/ParE family toxin [Candidatus Hydrothermarchaeales archaeon]
MVIKRVIRSKEFERQFKKIRDKKSKEILVKHIKKLCKNPDLGKPLEGTYKGVRSERVGPFRLLYALKGETLYLVRFRHRKKVYK